MGFENNCETWHVLVCSKEKKNGSKLYAYSFSYKTIQKKIYSVRQVFKPKWICRNIMSLKIKDQHTFT